MDMWGMCGRCDGLGKIPNPLVEIFENRIEYITCPECMGKKGRGIKDMVERVYYSIR